MLQNSTTADGAIKRPARSRWVLSGVLISALALIAAYILLSSQEPVMVLQTHDSNDRVEIVTWSPDGTRLVSASRHGGGPVIIWDAETGQRLHTLYDIATIWDIAWSPGSELLAVAEQDVTIDQPVTPLVIWDVETGKKVRTLNDGYTVRSIDWSPDGTRLAMVGEESELVSVWEIDSGELLYDLQDYHSLVVAWSPDGRWLASGYNTEPMYIFDAESGDLSHTLSSPVDVDSIVWSPDSKRIVVAGLDIPEVDRIAVWDLTIGDPPLTLQTPEKDGRVTAIAWSPDGRFLASAMSIGTIAVWDMSSYRLAQTLGNPTDTDKPELFPYVAWSPDGKRLASTSFADSIFIWDMAR